MVRGVAGVQKSKVELSTRRGGIDEAWKRLSRVTGVEKSTTIGTIPAQMTSSGRQSQRVNAHKLRRLVRDRILICRSFALILDDDIEFRNPASLRIFLFLSLPSLFALDFSGAAAAPEA
ncbi:hypothetical protein KFK09_018693 [Dendrobium nobile]|uniref:Uncharacterized protein n=1 Tax=Dendrobium nobile TaxID=94219 RepID=A0A8T3AWH1_DENNO|nr:hypothetical protein KFK09_018693 [Dendrobium nobile]